MINQIKKPHVIMMFVAIAVLLVVLLIPLGVGEGGSQYLFLQRAGLSYQTTPQSGIVQVVFGSENRAFLPANAYEALIGLTNFIPNIFDLRVLGFLYSLLLLLGIGLLIKGASKREYKWHAWLSAVLIVFVLCDFAYTTYFNSLFWNPFSMVLFVLSAGLLTLLYRSGEAGIGKVIGLFVCGIILASISTITAVLAIIIGLLLIRILTIGKNTMQKIISALCGLAVVFTGIFFAVTYTAPTYQSDLYSAVFLGTAQHESVTELGLNPKLDELKGVFYSPEVVEKYELKQNLYDKIGYGDIAQFYFTHPNAFIGALNAAASNGFQIRLSYAGNFTESSSAGQLAKGFNLYSFLKNSFMPNTIIFVLFVFIAYFGVLCALYFNKNTTKERKMLLEALFGLGIGAIISFIMPYMQTGMLDIGRSMFVFYLLFDFMLISAVLGGSVIMIERRQNLKDKYGVEQ